MREIYFPFIKAGINLHPPVCTTGLCCIFYGSLYQKSVENSRSAERTAEIQTADEREDLSLSTALLVMPNLTMISGWVMPIPPSLQVQMVFDISILFASDYCYLTH